MELVMRATKMDNKITGPAVAGQKRKKNGQYEAKGLNKKGHFVRLTPDIQHKINKLQLTQVNFADLCRLALDEYLDKCEQTGDRPPLPKIEPLSPKPPKIKVGEQVYTEDGIGIVISTSRGWYRVKLENEVVFKRLSELKKIM
jgi:hypothetical protein